jgi:predicted negative regulator of RcsB-dependent stress response
MVKVADQHPHTDQATLALLAAADASFTKRDFPAAIQDYQRIIDATGTDPELADSARIGLGSTFEATDKVDDAIHTYVEVGDRGDKSPYAAFAYDAAARLYQQRGDKDNARKMLTVAAGLDSDAPSVKMAQESLKQLAAADQPPMTFPVNNGPVPTITAPAPAK